MHDARINTVPMWLLKWSQEEEAIDENGDYTGESETRYQKPVKIRVNLSPAHGSAEDEVFGASVDYSKIITTANMKLGIDEYSILTEAKPSVRIISKECVIEGDVGRGKGAYRVVRVAKGLYHMRYALKSLREDGQ